LHLQIYDRYAQMAVPLNSAGTGVAQLLFFCPLVLMSPPRCVFLIDEPHSGPLGSIYHFSGGSRAAFFVNSMSDFHESIPDEYIRSVFAVMAAANWHVFQVLTKRPRRMAALAPTLPWPKRIRADISVELDRFAWRANHYLSWVPAAVRFVSAEPLVGPLPSLDLRALSWVIAGGESGPGHRLYGPRLDPRSAGSLPNCWSCILPETMGQADAQGWRALTGRSDLGRLSCHPPCRTTLMVRLGQIGRKRIRRGGAWAAEKLDFFDITSAAPATAAAASCWQLSEQAAGVHRPVRRTGPGPLANGCGYRRLAPGCR
jgi:hypothetical protein